MRNNIMLKSVVSICLSAMLFTGVAATSANPAAAATTQSASSSSVSWSTKADRIIALAKRLQSKVQYQYGVNNPSRYIFDCASFTKYVYGKQGVYLRWGARSQYKMVKHIKKSQLRKGDLVFISTARTDAKYSDTLHKIAHVAIYMGNNKIIHNLSPKHDVVISDLNSSWYKKHYVAAGRVL